MSELAPPNSLRPRIENLSDLVFGLALSIGSIILITKLPETPTALVTAIVLFGASFLIVVWIWSGYTRIQVILPVEVEGALLLNLVLLFCVAVEPYLFYVTNEGPSSLADFASSVYAVDVGAMMLLLSALGYIVLREEKRRDVRKLPADRLNRFRRVMMWEVIAGAAFVISATPPFWVPVPLGGDLRFDSWYAVLAGFFAVGRLGRRTGDEKRLDSS